MTPDARHVQRLLIGLGEDIGTGGPSGKGDDGHWGILSQDALEAALARFAAPGPATVAVVGVAPGADRSIIDISAGATVRVGRMKQAPKVMLWHHTAGHLGPEGTVRVLNERGLSVQYVMSRDARMYLANPDLFVCYHAGAVDKAPWAGRGLGNGNMLGCEVDAKLPGDVTDDQVARAVRFAIDLETRCPGILHLGHGETSRRKMPEEGLRIAKAIRGPDYRIKPQLLRR